MSAAANLEAAWIWYLEVMSRLKAIVDWIKQSRPQFYTQVFRPALVA